MAEYSMTARSRKQRRKSLGSPTSPFRGVSGGQISSAVHNASAVGFFDWPCLGGTAVGSPREKGGYGERYRVSVRTGCPAFGEWANPLLLVVSRNALRLRVGPTGSPWLDLRVVRGSESPAKYRGEFPTWKPTHSDLYRALRYGELGLRRVSVGSPCVAAGRSL